MDNTDKKQHLKKTLIDFIQEINEYYISEDKLPHWVEEQRSKILGLIEHM